ncbi:P-II family nitrogen regulator [Ethanoligenens harbinense]|uniref:Nitrogen regulatory protein P-II n=1 Tax=Ethanoligenens harbinense (strain DSM 18485 / JCM 12961 / CGMCC 1.5033 / YUAN-3) TaxID=663278 RepID=E6U9G9_ETHHY|nr:P-II family nitrogen regulator [Ethanoligenens harbinense]ADU26160.1 nitrogen regulatory protein P-II [Ethanoligenens harbinense YUAN-3]AVQ95300.1 transcriptional regulator [Ethanoligenens harbinense YUAN-3]AYF37964.1 transcriptional regulator [Ethanoligenens harbinense]AYF40711.1 transcriptional regulator [Ethanoligenens harbinense]QCN91544.1 P-II family nitrogen regulator [Ethanoligenens harbinense]
MKELVLVIRPEMLEVLKSILDDVHCGGMTVSSVMGCGTQKGVVEGGINEIKGFKMNINLLPKIRVEVVVEDDVVEEIISSVRERMATGHVGDGKIFIRNIDGVVRIRTGERGVKAL